jgi:hypothetical protein
MDKFIVTKRNLSPSAERMIEPHTVYRFLGKWDPDVYDDVLDAMKQAVRLNRIARETHGCGRLYAVYLCSGENNPSWIHLDKPIWDPWDVEHSVWNATIHNHITTTG